MPTAACSRLVDLRDGTTVLLRRQTPHDRGQLELLYRQLSPRSRQLRFFAGMPDTPRPALLDHLAAVDGREHLAVLALHGGRAVGVARCVRDPRHPDRADLAFAVADAFQRRGLAVAILDELRERARAAGIARLTFDALGENVAAQRLLRGLGADLHAGGGLVSGSLPTRTDASDGRCAA